MMRIEGALDVFGTRVFVLDNSELPRTKTQVRFPRSKKRRIQKKWAKRAANHVMKTDINAAFWIGRDLFVSQRIMDQLRQQGEPPQ